jgi:predicted transcriptional regulator
MTTTVPVEIRSARQRLGLSRAQLAEISGVSESSIKRLEDPNRLPRRSRVLRDVRAALADHAANTLPPIPNDA